ncbi:MAG: 4Fe-4S binding protein [Clostridia bacterium]|nr:4Fe-4S binding protein [Clostridia bacterium]
MRLWKKGAWLRACKLDIPVWKKPNSADCIRCGECRMACPEGAIRIDSVLSGKKKS